MYVLIYICFSSFWLISFCMTDWIHTHLYKWPSFIPFYGWITCVCVCVCTMSSLSICQWMLRLFPCLAYCKQCCNEHRSACVFLNDGFLWMPRCEIVGSSIFSFLRNLHTVLHSDYQFTFPPAVREGFLFAAPSPAFTVCRFLNNGHSDGCELIPYCSFAFLWWLVMLSIFTCAFWPSLCLLWRNVYLRLLPNFWLGCLCFCYWAVCMLWRLIPCQLLSLQIFFFSHSEDALFISFMVLFAVQKFLSLIRSHLFIFV